MATITINTNSQQDQRIIAAFRAVSGNPNATGADVKAWLIQQISAMVHGYETKTAADAGANSVVPMPDAT
jgi:hypothetical protein